MRDLRRVLRMRFSDSPRLAVGVRCRHRINMLASFYSASYNDFSSIVVAAGRTEASIYY